MGAAPAYQYVPAEDAAADAAAERTVQLVVIEGGKDAAAATGVAEGGGLLSTAEGVAIGVGEGVAATVGAVFAALLVVVWPSSLGSDDGLPNAGPSRGTAPSASAIPAAVPQSGKVVQGCSAGDCDEKCRALAAEIWERYNVLTGRIQELRLDKLDLFNLARSSPSPSLPKGSGSWDGHIYQANGWQRGLQNKLNQYDALGCKQPPIPNSIRALAYQNLPIQPDPK